MIGREVTGAIKSFISIVKLSFLIPLLYKISETWWTENFNKTEETEFNKFCHNNQSSDVGIVTFREVSEYDHWDEEGKFNPKAVELSYKRGHVLQISQSNIFLFQILGDVSIVMFVSQAKYPDANCEFNGLKYNKDNKNHFVESEANLKIFIT